MVLSKTRYIIFFTLMALSLIATVACTQNTPEPAPAASSVQATTASAPIIAISATRVPIKSFIDMKGSGFTPKSDLYSHLKKPDGNEYPVIIMLSDAKGEITHQIDTLLLMIGTHELWVVDSKTGISSNVLKFEIYPN